MRVIAGSARRLNLKTPNGEGTRPTTDRIKETLFNMLQDDIYGCRFLDLFAGSGGIGIEALSRGAKEAVFVERAREAIECIKYNLNFTHLAEQGTLMAMDVASAIGRLEGKGTFDIIFMDPPYDQLIEKNVLEQLSRSTIVDEETLVIVEASMETDFSYLEQSGWEVVKRKEYKTNVHMFLRKA